MNFKNDEPSVMCEKLGIKLTSLEKDLEGKQLLKVVMPKWLPAADAMVQMVIKYLPSPITAQKYRMETMYEGPVDDTSAISIRNCDASGPLMLYVSNIVPTTNDRFYAFGRVFSGTIKPGLDVRIQGPKYVPGKKEDLTTTTVKSTVLMVGSAVQPVPEVPAGSILGLVLGVDRSLLQPGVTITTSETAYNLTNIKTSSYIIQVSVRPENAADQAKLAEGLSICLN
jgi:elongation factor 2